MTASFTKTGAPVYFTAQSTWSPNLQSAGLFETVAERDAKEAEANRAEAVACDIYTFMVCEEAGVIDPLSAREGIRAGGPTVAMRRPDSGFGQAGA